MLEKIETTLERYTETEWEWMFLFQTRLNKQFYLHFLTFKVFSSHW